ncbi:beethoven [Carabus blaptoides fortunei]
MGVPGTCVWKWNIAAGKGQERRLKFPRFLFLGDDDLLEILGQSSREQVIQAHLKKLFSGIHSVKMNKEFQHIFAMCSLQGEVVSLSKPVNVNCPVEDWLNELVSQMQTTLHTLLMQCLEETNQKNFGPDPLQYPSQVLCLTESIVFTVRCEQAIKSATIPALLTVYKNQLNNFSSFDLDDDINSDKNDHVLELKLKALMLDTIHHINVIEELIDYNVTFINDWHWQKQLRFYNTNNSTIIARMANAQMNYSFEYLGNASKLVRTPLTDKCFLTLTQGMHLGLGGNPYGPAGTGKTESVKALGSLLGRQVLVFNCDENVDATSMGRILSGLVRTGAWGCFDEFNRLDEATLSAVSMHIQPIQFALQANKKFVTLLNQEMEINPHCGIFVTLNPVGGGYKGRHRLPDNLKQLFRPVVMSHPDHEQIARTLLRCDGYRQADIIGCKLVEIFSMSSELLSKQQHYDWGLRALKTVLGSCGLLKSRIKGTTELTQPDLLEKEMQLAVQALRVNTLSKLTYSDSKRFDAIVSDVFIGVSFENTGHETLINALQESCTELGLQINDRQISKCVELYEQLQQRMGVTIVGPSGSGKSTLRKLLLRALNKTNHSVSQHVFNPKAMTRAQLLGQIDLDTRQWTDGVLTLYALQVYAEPTDVWSWVVCDGDIDPEWVESLNSVLDDNRLLTLPSGWRIQFGPNVNFLFETQDLTYASPATISRMGIVFLSEEDVKLSHIVNNWLTWQPEQNVGIVSHLINDYFFNALDWINSEGDLVIPCSNVAIVQTGLSQLRKIFSKSHFTVALIAGLGGLLTQSTRETFAQKIFEWTGEHYPDEKFILRCCYVPNRDIIDIYYSDSNYQISENKFNELPLILTGQILYTLNTLKTWLSTGTEEHFLLIGPHGSAKSLIINYLLKEEHNMDIATIYCSSNINPEYVLHKLTQYCMMVYIY